MAFTELETDLSNISALSDRPNDDDGMSAAALKAAFDAAGNAIKLYINETLIPELEASGADSIGIEPITGLPGTTNVQEALVALLDALDDVQAGTVTDGSITTPKLGDLAVTTAKLSELAVVTSKIADLAVTTAKLANLAVTTEKLAGRSVTGEKLALTAVNNEHIGSKAVKQANIDDSAVGTNQIASGAVTPVKTTGIQKVINAANATLTVSGWTNKSQRVTVSDITANSRFVASPNNAEGWAAAADAMLYPPTADAGGLTFTCDTVPSAAIPLTVYFWEA